MASARRQPNERPHAQSAAHRSPPCLSRKPTTHEGRRNSMISDVRITPRERARPYRAGHWLFAVTVAALTAIAPQANAQTTTGGIRGYVRGPNAIAITDA